MNYTAVLHGGPFDGEKVGMWERQHVIVKKELQPWRRRRHGGISPAAFHVYEPVGCEEGKILRYEWNRELSE